MLIIYIFLSAFTYGKYVSHNKDVIKHNSFIRKSARYLYV